MSLSGGSISEEQRKKIEENRRKALEKRARLNTQGTQRQQAIFQSPTLHGARRRFPTLATANFKQQAQGDPKEFEASFQCGQLQVQNSVQISNQNANCETVSSSSNEKVRSVKLQAQNDPLSIQSNSFQTDGSSASRGSTDSITRSDFGSKGQSFGIEMFFSSNHSSSSITASKQPQKKYDKTVDNLPIALPSSDKDVKLVKGTCVLINSTRFAVKIGFHAQLIALIKTIPSRSYDASTTTWNFSLEDYKTIMSGVKTLPSNIRLEGLPKAVLSTYMKSTPGTLKTLSVQELNLNSVDTKLVSALMPFQKDGVSFCIRHDGRALIADDMGLGKTVQAICVASFYRKEWPLLVVTPSSVRVAWKQAFLRWLPSVDPQRINVVLTGKDDPAAELVNIISYDLLAKFIDKLKKKQFRVIIADESHFIKNYKAARTKVALPLLKAATRVILLSGTPALSRPEELYTQISAVRSNLFPSFHEFGKRYCAGVENRWGWDYSGASNMEELHLILEGSIMIRRLKEEVMTQLPSKRRQMVLLDPCLVKTKSLQRAAKQAEKAQEKEQHGALLNYFCETSESKIAAVKNYILDLLEGGHKFLVFAHHKIMLDAISDCLAQKKYQYIRIDGSTPSSKRQMLCDKFQNNKDVVVAVLSITAANTGLTLTEGTTVVFAELFWNPGSLVQAEDRVHRIGQKNSVNIHYLVAKGTADDHMWPLIQNKLKVLSKAGLSKDDFSNADMAMFKDPKQKTLFSCFKSIIEGCDVTDNNITESSAASLTAINGSETVTMETSTVDDVSDVETKDFPPSREAATKTQPASNASRFTCTEKKDQSDIVEGLGNTMEFDWFDCVDGEELLLETNIEITKSTARSKDAREEIDSTGEYDDPTQSEGERSRFNASSDSCGEPSAKRSKR